MEKRFLEDRDFCIIRPTNKFAYESLVNGDNEKSQLPICMFMRAGTKIIGVDCEQGRFSVFSYGKIYTEITGIDADHAPTWKVTDLCKFYKNEYGNF